MLKNLQTNYQMKLILQSFNIFHRVKRIHTVGYLSSQTRLFSVTASGNNSVDDNIKILRSANAVCFDVDSTVIMDEGIQS